MEEVIPEYDRSYVSKWHHAIISEYLLCWGVLKRFWILTCLY